MRTPGKTHFVAALIAAAAITLGGCSRPAPNDPVRITGDKTDAVPVTPPPPSTTTSTIPPTTAHYGPAGGGAGGGASGGATSAPAMGN